MAQDFILFAREFFASPFQVAAVSPSSRYLARAMAAGFGAKTGPVVEFGPGTGQLTRGILAAGVPPTDLTLIEMSADFARHLASEFAGVTVHILRNVLRRNLQLDRAGRTGCFHHRRPDGRGFHRRCVFGHL